MRAGWTLNAVHDLAFLKRGKSRHRPRNEPSLYGGEYPFVQTADIHNSDLYVTSYSQTYNEKGLEQSKLWEPDTICITIAGENTGDCAILGIRACFPDSIIGVIADPSKADTIFLKYAIDGLRLQIRNITRGATQDNLSVTKFSSFRFPTPPVEVQRRIGTILRNYGDLIDNNRRRITLLEETARQRYKEWFVRLRFPGYEHAKIDDGIPEGWQHDQLNNHISFERGVEPGSANYLSKPGPGLIPFLRVGDLGGRPSGIFIDPEFSDGKVLNMEDIVITLDGTVGLVRLGLEGAYSSGIRRVVRTDNCSFGWAFIYELLQSDDIQAIIQAHARGTTIKHAGAAIEAMKFLRPAGTLLGYFEDQVAPMLRQIIQLLKLNSSLAAARKLILPRLMSGEIVA